MDTKEERNRQGEKEKERKRNGAERAKSDGVGRASDGRRDGRLDSITWRTILPRRHCLLEHLLGFSWFGTSSAPYPVSRYTTIFCLPTITPTTTKKMRTRRRMKMRTTMARTMLPICLVDLGILGWREYILESLFHIDETRIRIAWSWHSYYIRGSIFFRTCNVEIFGGFRRWWYSLMVPGSLPSAK